MTDNELPSQSIPTLPKGFIDHRGHYVIKNKRTHQDLLNLDEVNGWKNMLLERKENANKYDLRIIEKELKKLERINNG